MHYSFLLLSSPHPHKHKHRMYLQRLQCHQLRGENKAVRGSVNRSQKKKGWELHRCHNPNIQSLASSVSLNCETILALTEPQTTAALRVIVGCFSPANFIFLHRSRSQLHLWKFQYFQQHWWDHQERIPVDKYRKVKCLALNVYFYPYPFACLHELKLSAESAITCITSWSTSLLTRCFISLVYIVFDFALCAQMLCNWEDW